jgi:hypothetical protein
VDDSIHADIIKLAAKSGKDSLEEAVSDVIAVLGWWTSKHSPTSQDKVQYHNHPNEKQVMKAINCSDVIHTDTKRNLIEIIKKADLKEFHAVVITFRHQNPTNLTIDKTGDRQRPYRHTFNHKHSANAIEKIQSTSFFQPATGYV